VNRDRWGDWLPDVLRARREASRKARLRDRLIARFAKVRAETISQSQKGAKGRTLFTVKRAINPKRRERRILEAEYARLIGKPRLSGRQKVRLRKRIAREEAGR
jgi:hypothetical protein